MDKKTYAKLYIWVLSFYKPYVIRTFAYIMLGGLMIWGEITIPRRIGVVIDQVIPHASRSLFFNHLLELMLLMTVVIVSKLGFTYLEMDISTRIVGDQRSAMLVQLYRLGTAYSEKLPTGQLLSVFENSTQEIQQTYTFLFPQLIYNAAKFFVPSLILLSERFEFFIASMIGNLIYVLLNRKTNKKIHDYLVKETKAAHQLQQSMFDTLAGRKELKSHGASNWHINRVLEDFDDYRIPRMWSIFWRHFRYTTVGFSLTISLVLFYVWGLVLIQSDQLLLGEFIGYSFLMGVASRGFSVFFYIIPAQSHALNYAKDVYDFMQCDPLIIDSGNQDIASKSSSDIVFEEVSFHYENGQQVLKNVSFTIPSGKRTAIVGESGSGKSTILKLIGRFYDSTNGRVLINGSDIKDYKLLSLRGHLGYVFQDTNFVNLSVRDNIAFGLQEVSHKQVVTVAQQAKAHRFIMGLSEGYDTIIGERGSTLSGGERQRLSLARMLIRDPDVILLDEATSALDTITENELKESIHELSSNKTLVTVAHRLSTIVDYDKIIVLKDGQVVETGDFDTLMGLSGYFYQLVGKGGEGIDEFATSL